MVNNLIILLVCAFSFQSQTRSTINYKDISFINLTSLSGEADIVASLGKADKVRVYYECGFHSEDEQGKPFYELRYEDVIWVGNQMENYVLDKVKFDRLGRVKLSVSNHELSGNSKQQDLEKLFQQKASPVILENDKSSSFWISLSFENSDDGCHFIFENGLLVEYGYFSPC